MYVQTLTIENLRCFEKVTLELRHPARRSRGAGGSVRHLPNVTVLLGDNGLGKTTVLRAVALGALAPVMAMGSGYLPFSLVRRTRAGTAKEAKVRVDLNLERHEFRASRNEPQEIRLLPVSEFHDVIQDFNFPWIEKWRDRLFDARWPGFFVVGYGANRRVEPTRNVDETSRLKERAPRYLRVASLFEENVTLMPLSTWLPRWKALHPARHRQIIHLMNKLLPGARLLEQPQQGEYLFQIGGSRLPFAALSDGYRAYVGWISDLLYHLSVSTRGQGLVDHRGVVLIDEIDLHLHPQWQRQVIPQVAEALPNLQFILTTHSPIVVGTLSSENVLRVREEETPRKGISRSIIERLDEEMYGFTADQILTSNAFGLESTRDEAFFHRLQDAARRARGGKPEEAIRFMRLVSGGPAAVPPESPGTGDRKRSPVRGKKSVARRTAARKK